MHGCNLHMCPCGCHGDAERQCTCSPAPVGRYQKRVSGPLLDRLGEPSAAIQYRPRRAE